MGFYSPEKPLWHDPQSLLTPESRQEQWVTIDGITPIAGVHRTHQLVMLNDGAWFVRQLPWVLKEIRTHLGYGSESWSLQNNFMRSFIGVFLKKYSEFTILLQVLPQRRTFRNLHVDLRLDADGRQKNSGVQKVVRPTLGFPAIRLGSGDVDLELANGIVVPSDGLLMFGRVGQNSTHLDLRWTRIEVERSLGTQTFTEVWSCLAAKEDVAKIKSAASVPALEPFFDSTEMVQRAPIVSFCAITRTGMIRTHCFSLHPNSGHLIDIRQGSPS